MIDRAGAAFYVACMFNSEPRSASTTNRAAIGESLERGRRAEEAGNLHEARTLYSEALAFGCEEPDWLYRLGCVCLKLGDFAAARLNFEKGLSRRPGDARMLTNLGAAFDRLGLREDALSAYRRAVLKHDAPAAAHHNLGALYAETGQTEHAIRAFGEAVRKAPDADGYCNLGLVLLTADDPVQAQESFERSVACDHRHVRGHYYAAVCLLKRGRYREALRRFDLVLDLEPSLARAHFHRGVCLHKLEEFPSALTTLMLAETAFPEDGRVHFQLALTLDALGRSAEARNHYHHARLLQEGARSCDSAP
jgi:tetratricopeptide (TPR) repeat protein